MTLIDKIRAEIKKLQDIFVETAQGMETEDEATVYSMCAVEFGAELLSFLDTLPDEPEQPTRGYDEAYLNEKIAKASKSWKEVDVDKFMDEVRGREKTVTDCHDLTEAAEKYADLNCHNHVENETDWSGLLYAFKAGAGWMAKQQPLPEDSVAFQKGVQEGKRLMMEGETYNELMELYMAIRDEIIKRHRDAAVNIKEKTMDLKEDTGNESALHQIRG